MKIEIYSLGAIEKATIELKPFTVFIGENSTGKTWTAYTLSAILGSIGYEHYLKTYLDGKIQPTYLPLDEAIKQLLDEGYVQMDIVQFVKDYTEIYVNDVACFAKNWMPKFMNTKRATFDNLWIHFDFSPEFKTALVNKIIATSVVSKSSIGNKEDSLNVVKEAEESTLYLYSEGDILNKLPRRMIQEFFLRQLFDILRKNLYSEVHVFPTERIDFKLQPEGAFKGLFQEGKVEHVFLPFAQRTIMVSPKQRLEEIDKTPKISEYVQLAEYLETEILEGRVDFDDSKQSNELVFQMEDGAKLELTISSSMVKELAPLVLYLRYLAKQSDWIIIDEPEMNLHPTVQIKLTEFLALLVNAGLHVLITTHSPYIVDHLANLMQAAQYENKEDIKELFYLEQTDAFIPQEQVSIALFENGTTTNLIDEKGSVDWSTFSHVCSDIAGIFPQLITTD
jgi:predicted ATP-dependent endonuclease of OLD family